MTGIGFHPEARRELRETVAYYDERADGLGARFGLEVERAVNRLAQTPGVGAPVQGDPSLRRWPIPRFPYYLIYAPEDDALIVFALAHQRRRPGYWDARTP